MIEEKNQICLVFEIRGSFLSPEVIHELSASCTNLVCLARALFPKKSWSASRRVCWMPDTYCWPSPVPEHSETWDSHTDYEAKAQLLIGYWVTRRPFGLQRSMTSSAPYCLCLPLSLTLGPPRLKELSQGLLTWVELFLGKRRLLLFAYTWNIKNKDKNITHNLTESAINFLCVSLISHYISDLYILLFT